MITRCTEPGCRFSTFATDVKKALAQHQRQWHERQVKAHPPTLDVIQSRAKPVGGST